MMCNNTCDLCGKNSNTLIDVGGGVKSCPNVIECENSKFIRTLTGWTSIDDTKVIHRIDAFSRSHAKTNLKPDDLLYHCEVYNGNGVWYYTVKPTKYSAMTWCDNILKENGWILNGK